MNVAVVETMMQTLEATAHSREGGREGGGEREKVKEKALFLLTGGLSRFSPSWSASE